QNMATQVNISKADAEAFKKEMELARGEKAKVDDQLAKQTAAAAKEKQSLDSRITQHSDDLKRAREEIGKHVAAQNAAGGELDRRAKEVEHLKSLSTLREVELTKQKKQNVDMRQVMVEATINASEE